MSESATLSATIEPYYTDHELYCRDNLKIRTKDSLLAPLIFNEPQRIVHEKITEQRARIKKTRAIILKARQEGVSTYVSARFYRRVHLFPRIEALIVADEKKRAGRLFEIPDRFHSNLPEPLRLPKKFNVKHTELVYQGSDSSIRVLASTDPEAGRATTIQLLHASELAFWKGAEDTWDAVLQAVPEIGDTEIIVESTANGVGNLFHQLWELAESGTSEWIAIFLPWWIHTEYRVEELSDEDRAHIEGSSDPFEREAQDAGILYEGTLHKLSPEQLMWRRRIIRDKLRGDVRKFRQEYPSTAEEAFLVSGAAFFDEEALRRYRNSTALPTFRGDVEHVGGGIVPVEREFGYLKIFAQPTRGGVYAIGADTAEGRAASSRTRLSDDDEGERGGRDFSSAHVFEIRNRRYVATLHGRMAPEEFAKRLWLLGYYYGSPARGIDGTVLSPALLGVEANHSSGETVLRELKERYRYPMLYYHRVVNRRSQVITTRLGWLTNAETRQLMLDELAAALRFDAVWLPDGDTIREFFTFVRGDDGKPAAQDECHDDRVISSAISLQMARYVMLPAKPLPPEDLVDTPTGYDSYGWDELQPR